MCERVCVCWFPETARAGDAAADGESRRGDSGAEGDVQFSAAGGRHQNQEAEEGSSSKLSWLSCFF